MILAQVKGSVTSTRKHPSFDGWKLLICQPVDPYGKLNGSPVVAIDPQGAGVRDHVIVSTDGKAARNTVGDRRSPVRHMIVAIVDNVTDMQHPKPRTRNTKPETRNPQP